MPETHVAISFEQAHAIVLKWRAEWAAEVQPGGIFRPPQINEQLAETIGIPGVVYKWDAELVGIKFRRKGRPWFWTGLPLWEAPEHVLDAVRVLMKTIISGRTHAIGFNIGV